jgi:hypothetical protein
MRFTLRAEEFFNSIPGLRKDGSARGTHQPNSNLASRNTGKQG